MTADTWTIVGAIAAVLVAVLTLVDFLDKRWNYLKKFGRWALKRAPLLRSRTPVLLEIPELSPTRVPVFPDPAMPLHTPDGVHKELVKFIFRGSERLMASRVTRDGFPGINYLVEWQRPHQNPKSVQAPNRAQANDQWLSWYQEWKKQPGGFGGASGTGLDGMPPFTE